MSPKVASDGREASRTRVLRATPFGHLDLRTRPQGTPAPDFHVFHRSIDTAGSSDEPRVISMRPAAENRLLALSTKRLRAGAETSSSSLSRRRATVRSRIARRTAASWLQSPGRAHATWSFGCCALPASASLRTFLQTSWHQSQAQLSPDGAGIAYTSEQTIRQRGLKLETFPSPGQQADKSRSKGACSRAGGATARSLLLTLRQKIDRRSSEVRGVDRLLRPTQHSKLYCRLGHRPAGWRSTYDARRTGSASC
jgi:hypothetical protein